jgi:hypothetical protein
MIALIICLFRSLPAHPPAARPWPSFPNPVVMIIVVSLLAAERSRHPMRPGTSFARRASSDVGYNPVNFGARLALKASTPSLKSSDWRRRL